MRNVMVAFILVMLGMSGNYLQTSQSGSAGESSGAGSLSRTKKGNPNAPANKADPAAKENSPIGLDHPLTVLFDYLGPFDAAADSPSFAKCEVGGNASCILTADVLVSENEYSCDALRPFLRRLLSEYPHDRIRTLVAALPDPVQTNLSLLTDRWISSIVSASDDGGYQFDRYWLPWEHPIVIGELGKSGAKKEAKDRSHQPGLLLFRNKENVHEILAVFLVGETPTRGIDRSQFEKAACYVYALGAESDEIRFLGPTFSGSGTSLLRALEQDLYDEQVLRAITGSASGINGLNEILCHSPRRNTISTTLNSADESLDKLLEWVDTHENSRLAVLAEEATGFGSGIVQSQSESKLAGKPRRGGRPIVLQYPREIASLRNAYPDDPSPKASDRGTPGPAMQRLMPFTLRDSREGRDVIPHFSTGHTSLTHDTVLIQIAEVLRRENVGTAIITGTDILDVMFLSQFFHKNSPNVRLILFDSDLLLVHGTDVDDYAGMISVSTYPLFPMNDRWTGYEVNRRFFGSDNEIGRASCRERVFKDV